MMVSPPWRLPLAALSLLALMALLQLWAPALDWQRFAIAHGAVWRLLTGHLVHLNWTHLALNGSGLLLLAWVFRDEVSPGQAGLAALVLAVLVGVGLYLGDPSILRYAGFSGVLHGLLYAALVLTWRRTPWVNTVALLVLLGRLYAEQQSSYDTLYLQAWIGAPVAVDAHLYGALGGVILGGIGLLWSVLHRAQAVQAP